MAKEMQWKKLYVDLFDEFSQWTLLSLVLLRWRHAVQYKNDQFLKFSQKNFIFAQKQNMPKFCKNLPNFQKLPNTCSPAFTAEDIPREEKWAEQSYGFPNMM